jgi:transcriptional regulator with XRE-family HTH domain
METFGEYIRQLRANTGLPLRKIAAQLDIDPSIWGRIERKANKELIAKMAEIYNEKEEDLLKKFVSDNIAYKIIAENLDVDVLKVAEQKVKYLKSK